MLRRRVLVGRLLLLLLFSLLLFLPWDFRSSSVVAGVESFLPVFSLS